MHPLRMKLFPKLLNETWSVKRFVHTLRQGAYCLTKDEEVNVRSVSSQTPSSVHRTNQILNCNTSKSHSDIKNHRVTEYKIRDIWTNEIEVTKFCRLDKNKQFSQGSHYHLLSLIKKEQELLADKRLSSFCTSTANLHYMRRKNVFENRLLTVRSIPNNIDKRRIGLSPKDILDASPAFIQPYMKLIRFDKPIGTWLLYWPCTWSIAMAADAGSLPDLWLLTLFGAGSFFMRGAGCIINDMWDRDFDKMVARTKLRPLASGELSMFQGLVCLAGMLSVSLGILLQLNMFSVILGASSMALVILYPVAKRFTYFPQAMLGLTFNYGALLGWAAVQGSVDLTVVLPLYFGCFNWTMLYDTIYAHQDKYDDMLIGVKSTALKFGDKTKPWLSGFAGVTISGLVMAGVMSSQTWPYYAATAFTSTHLLHQILSVDLDNADDCAAKFRSNTWLGLVMFLGTVFGTLNKPKPADNTTDQTIVQ